MKVEQFDNFLKSEIKTGLISATIQCLGERKVTQFLCAR